MSEDNRKRPCIIRVLPVVNKRVRAYAARQGLAPNVAAEALINGAAGEIAALDAALVTLRAELESAREATRRADAEAERLTRELAGERLKTEAAQAREQQARTEAADLQARRSGAAPCACALPDDLAARVKARIKARPGRDFAFVVKNGCDRLEASDKYVDAKRAAKEA